MIAADLTSHGAFVYDERPAALGLVLTEGPVAFHLIHGEALVAAAAWAMGEASVTLVDASVPWAALAEADEPVVLHEACCPLTPPDFIAACVDDALASGRPVVGVRPVTDTIKRTLPTADGVLLGATLDRDALHAVCSPVVLPPGLAGEWTAPPDDVVAVAAHLAARYDVVWREAPPLARRVESAAEITLLEALSKP